jgi:hypothetical protein
VNRLTLFVIAELVSSALSVDGHSTANCVTLWDYYTIAIANSLQGKRERVALLITQSAASSLRDVPP